MTNVLDLAIGDSTLFMLLVMVEDLVMVRYLGSLLNIRFDDWFEDSIRRWFLFAKNFSVKELECGKVFFFLSVSFIS